MSDLPILQKTYDFVKWYVPTLNHLPRTQKYLLGDRLITNLYTFLEILVDVQYQQRKLATLNALNRQLEVIRYQTRLLYDFKVMKVHRYEHVSKLMNEIGIDLGGWIKQQRRSPPTSLDRNETRKEIEKPTLNASKTL